MPFIQYMQRQHTFILRMAAVPLQVEIFLQNTVAFHLLFSYDIVKFNQPAKGLCRKSQP